MTVVKERSRTPRRWAALAVLPLLTAGGSPRRIEQIATPSVNVRAFAKLYGYVRFFHPSDEASRIDWDRFAFLGVDRVKDASSVDVLQERLEELLRPMRPAAPAGAESRANADSRPQSPHGSAPPLGPQGPREVVEYDIATFARRESGRFQATASCGVGPATLPQPPSPPPAAMTATAAAQRRGARINQPSHIGRLAGAYSEARRRAASSSNTVAAGS